MSSENHADFIVLGAGPGGYAAAFRAADLGRDVVLVDPRATLGGVCLNEGCIPSKALLHAAEVIREAHEMSEWGIKFTKPKVDLDALRAKKDKIVNTLTGGLVQLAKKRKVKVVKGTAKFTSPKTLEIDGVEWSFTDAVIAVGSSSISLPGWPDDNRIWDSTAALELREIPEKLAIVGGGIIGLEMATVYSALGSKVTIVELGNQIAPGAEPDAVRILAKSLESQGCKIYTDTRVESVKASKASLTLSCTGAFDGNITANIVVQSVGRSANGNVVGADAAGITVQQNGTIEVNNRCITSQPHIYAIGDVTGGPMLAHRATHQGKVAAEVACGHNAAMDTDLIPAVCYTNPEMAWIGLTADQAKTSGIPNKSTTFPWAASGRNLASGGGDGLTKIVYCPDSERILGATLIGANAGELLAEMVLAVEMGATLTDIALTVHAHPTLSETTAFAAERALGTLTDM